MVCINLFISLLFLMIIFTTTQVRFKAEGKTTPKFDSFSKVNEEKAMVLRGQIGSRPPRCERRCSSCEHCEAIQVPTNPQLGDDSSSNYKPLSWKCKCGNFIFNP